MSPPSSRGVPKPPRPCSLPLCQARQLGPSHAELQHLLPLGLSRPGERWPARDPLYRGSPNLQGCTASPAGVSPHPWMMCVGARWHHGADPAGGSGSANAMMATCSVPCHLHHGSVAWRGAWVTLWLKGEVSGGVRESSPCQAGWPRAWLALADGDEQWHGQPPPPVPACSRIRASHGLPPPQMYRGPRRKGLTASPYLQLHFKDVKLKPVIYSPHTRRSN